MMSSWNEIDANRRRELLDRMVELADDNIEFDYSTLFRACLSDKDEGVRARAARSLWDSDDRTNIRPLVNLLTQDDSAEVRAAAATALGKFVEMTEEGKLIRREGQKIADALVGVIENPQERLETRCRAIEAVAPLTSEKVHSIIEQAYRDDDIRLRQSAIYAMGRRPDSSWLPTVLRETRHVEAAIRYEAVTASGHSRRRGHRSPPGELSQRHGQPGTTRRGQLPRPDRRRPREKGAGTGDKTRRRRDQRGG